MTVFSNQYGYRVGTPAKGKVRKGAGSCESDQVGQLHMRQMAEAESDYSATCSCPNLKLQWPR